MGAKLNVVGIKEKIRFSFRPLTARINANAERVNLRVNLRNDFLTSEAQKKLGKQKTHLIDGFFVYISIANFYNASIAPKSLDVISSTLPSPLILMNLFCA